MRWQGWIETPLNKVHMQVVLKPFKDTTDALELPQPHFCQVADQDDD